MIFNFNEQYFHFGMQYNFLTKDAVMLNVIMARIKIMGASKREEKKNTNCYVEQEKIKLRCEQKRE